MRSGHWRQGCRWYTSSTWTGWRSTEKSFGRRSGRHAGGTAERELRRLAEAHVGEIILPDGRNLNQEIVRAGLAWWYQQYARRETVLRDLEQEARAAKRGLWIDPKPVAPWEWRKGRWPPWYGSQVVSVPRDNMN
jgi:hypothetical protein